MRRASLSGFSRRMAYLLPSGLHLSFNGRPDDRHPALSRGMPDFRQISR
ncbi:hypothetical protein KCP76_23345 [Salmonella enterica subsp. enterica serovar Weltevreden]|nr:hypothetical protein KCP76_23345 [Salmonella enterica subsp. enterica serovar Weltevreden]